MAENQSIVRTVAPNLASCVAGGQQTEISGSTCAIVATSQDRIKLSKRRWLILFAIWVFAFTSALCSELSPILRVMTKLLDLDVDQYIYIGQISFYLLVFVAMPTAWFVDRYGIRVSMYVSVVLMMFRNGLRALLFYPSSPHWHELRMIYYIISSIIGMVAFTLFFCLPLKISELWFSSSERSVAWTIMISAFSLGVSVGAATFPRLIHEDLKTIDYLAYLNLGCAVITAPIVLLCITRSEPKHPPSERMIKSSHDDSPYFKSIKKMIKQKDILLHVMHHAVFEGLTLAISSLIQDLFASVSKSKVFIGDLVAINSMLSIAAVVTLAVFVHKVKNITLVCKLGSFLQAVALIAHLATMRFPLPDHVVLGVSFILTISKSWFLPNSTNMTAHLASGTVSQATISGFCMTFAIVVSNIIQTIFVTLSIKIDSKRSDYSYSLMFSTILCLVNTMIYGIFFTGQAAVTESDENETDGNERRISSP